MKSILTSTRVFPFCCIFIMLESNAVPTDVEYVGDWSTGGKIAFDYSVRQWSQLLQGDQTIKIKAIMEHKAGNAAGAASPTTHRKYFYPSMGERWTALPLYAQLSGNGDPATAEESPSGAGYHILVSFDSTRNVSGVEREYPWFFGPNGSPSVHPYYDGAENLLASIDSADFITVALHELGHGFGFTAWMRPDGQYWNQDGIPSAYEDALWVDSSGAIGYFTAQQVGVRATIMKAGSACDMVELFWGGGSLRAAVQQNLAHSCIGAGGYVAMYTPGTWKDGSSVSHVARGLEPEMLMAPQSAPGRETIYHTIPYDHMALQDIGWTVASAFAPSPMRPVVADLTSGGDTSKQQLRIYNTSTTQTTTIETIRLIGADASEFVLATATQATPIEVLPASSFSVEMEFVPMSPGRKNCLLEVESVSEDYLIQRTELTGYASDIDTDLDGISDFNEARDLNTTISGVQNPFNEQWRDWTSDDGQMNADGTLDGFNDWDSDGIKNCDELASGLDVLVPESMQTVEFSNTGNWPLRMDSYEIIGQHAADYSLASGDALSYVDPGTTHAIQVVFQPSATGTRSATLRVHYHDGVELSVMDIPLTGSGV